MTLCEQAKQSPLVGVRAISSSKWGAGSDEFKPVVKKGGLVTLPPKSNHTYRSSESVSDSQHGMQIHSSLVKIQVPYEPVPASRCPTQASYTVPNA